MASRSVTHQLSRERLDLLASVLDAIIPAGEDGGLPGAGELGLGEILQHKAPELVPVLEQGLDALGEAMGNSSPADFAELSGPEKRSRLESVGARQPAFLPAVIFQTYANYYQHPRVLEALGLEARPPYPLGYELEGGDLDLLEPVRERAPLYRRT